VEILKQVREAMRRERIELWPNDWIVHHNNAPAHKALSVKEFLAKEYTTEIDQPTYSPDLVPKGFWLFPKLKSA
jgi:transposase